MTAAGHSKFHESARAQVAGTATYVDDILEELEGIQAATAPPPVDAPPPPALDPVQTKIWEFLGQQPRHLDEIVQHLGMEVAQLSGTIFTMEMKKVVKRLPGNRYERR